MSEQIQLLEGQRCRVVTFDVETQEWIFDFALGIELRAGCPWWIITDRRIQLGWRDHGQKFGLPSELDGMREAARLLGDSPVDSAIIVEKTGDLVITLASSACLEVINHHVPDSHLNSYCRFKLALTEEEPTIKSYHEDRWAELEDSRATPIEVSLALLESLHKRWVLLLKSLEPVDFQRTFRHPEIGVVTLAQNACLYAWHGRHHAAHITSLRERMGWDK